MYRIGTIDGDSERGARHRSRFARIAALAIAAVTAAVAVSTPASAESTTDSFGCTGGAQTWTVPPGVTRVSVVVEGAAGGPSNTANLGLGGGASATLSGPRGPPTP